MLDIGEKVLKVCRGCEQVGYCGLQCQKRHWQEHKQACRGGGVQKMKTGEAALCESRFSGLHSLTDCLSFAFLLFR